MEYWITDDNEYIYAHSDAGIDVPNHMMVAGEYALYKLMEAIPGDNTLGAELYVLIEDKIEEFGPYDATAIRCAVHDKIDTWFNKQYIIESECDNIFDTFHQRLKIPRHLIEIAFDIEDNDPRAYAVQYWDWIRVINNNFDVRNVNRSTCERMFDFAMEHNNFRTWNVEIFNRKIYCRDISVSQLLSPRSVLAHK